MTTDRIYYSHDAEMHAMRKRAVHTLIFLTFGLAIGAVLALLLAPTSGRKARHNLARSIEEGMQSGRDSVEPMVKRVEKEFDDLKENVEEHLS